MKPQELSGLMLHISFILLTTFLFQCRAFAKALHYKEMEFVNARSTTMDANPIAVVELLIHINNQLHQHEVFICLCQYTEFSGFNIGYIFVCNTSLVCFHLILGYQIIVILFPLF